MAGTSAGSLCLRLKDDEVGATLKEEEEILITFLPEHLIPANQEKKRILLKQSVHSRSIQILFLL